VRTQTAVIGIPKITELAKNKNILNVLIIIEVGRSLAIIEFHK
jgi:hypothetical protein